MCQVCFGSPFITPKIHAFNYLLTHRIHDSSQDFHITRVIPPPAEEVWNGPHGTQACPSVCAGKLLHADDPTDPMAGWACLQPPTRKIGVNLHVCIGHPGVDRIWKFQQRSINTSICWKNVFYYFRMTVYMYDTYTDEKYMFYLFAYISYICFNLNTV